MDVKLTSGNIYAELPRLFKTGADVAVATIISSRGSTPQIAGSTALFTKDGLIAGTVGGGAVELSIQQKYVTDLEAGVSSLNQFNLANEISDDSDAICGGEMEVLLDHAPHKHAGIFEVMLASYHGRIPGLLLTIVQGIKSNRIDITRKWLTLQSIREGTDTADVAWADHAAEMLRSPRHGECRKIPLTAAQEQNIHFAFLQTVVPCSKLLIAGAGHVGKALSHLGKLLEFEVSIWDDRSDYATPENLPDADHILSGSIAETLAGIIPDRNTYIVIVTPGHKNDAEVLKTFIHSDAGYIGMIGSRKKTGLMRQKFLDSGWATPEEWDRIHSPIGLEINSKTVQEIAVSIAAQLVMERHRINQGHG